MDLLTEHNHLVFRKVPGNKRYVINFLQTWGPSCFLVLFTIIVYMPCLRGPFVWDDRLWTIDAEWLMSSQYGLWQIWTNPTSLQQYFPVTATSFWIDYYLWRFNSLPYHFENVLLHALSCVLFRRCLLKLQVQCAWFAAALLSMHPVMVESVAWITERKNVLSMTLFISALLAYGSYMNWWMNDMKHSKRKYLIALILFVLALLAKVTTFIFPPTLLLIAWWKRGRIGLHRDLRPALPFFGVAIVVGMLVAWLERNHVGANGKDFEIAYADQIVLSGQVFWFYLGKLIWPKLLCCIYHRWSVDSGEWSQWIAIVSVFVVTGLVFRLRERIGRGIITALLFYAGGLTPVLGFLGVYGMRFSWVADRWVYLPSLAFFAIIASSLSLVKSYRLRYVLMLFILLCTGTRTWNQAANYQSLDRFWQSAIAGNSSPWKAENDYGAALLEASRFEEAIIHFGNAIRIEPNEPDSFVNLGSAYLRSGQRETALKVWENALEKWPEIATIQYNMSRVLYELGQVDEAILRLRQSIELAPRMSVAHLALADILVLKGQLGDAESHYIKTLEIRPEHPGANFGMGNLMFRRGDPGKALGYFQRTLDRLPEQVQAMANCAWIMSTSNRTDLRNGLRAVELSERCVALTNQSDPAMLSSLASSYAEVERYTDAVRVANKALQIAETQGRIGLTNNLRNELSFYQAGQPFRE